MHVPVLIGGCPRSGTTLLASRLNGLITPESQFKADLFRAERQGASVNDLLKILHQSARYRTWRVEPDFSGVTNALSIISAVVEAYADYKGSRWIDHTPENAVDMAILRTVWPDAPFIHIVRDVRATVNSVMPLDWGPNTAGIGAQWWLERLAHGLVAEETGPSLRIKYEDLITSPDATIERVAKLVDLPVPSDVQTSNFTPPGGHHKQHQLINEKIDASRLTAWRNSLSTREVAVIEYIAGDLLEMLGYEINGSQTMARYWPLPEYIKDTLRRRINKLKYARRLK